MTESQAPVIGTCAVLADLIRSVSRLNDRAEVLDAVPPLVTRIGFDRAFVSEVVDGAWMPAAVYVPRDRRWADDIREAGRNAPQRLGAGVVEDQMLNSARPIHVDRVRGNPRVHQGIAQVSRSQAYLAVPVGVGNRLGAIVHVDRFWSRRRFCSEDVAALQAAGEVIGLVLERAALRESLERGAVPAAGTEQVEGGQERTGPERDSSVLGALTPREHEVAAMIADGLTNAQIAAELVVAEATVKTHIKHILRKLGARHRAEAVAVFLRSTPVGG
jgi:DNA-binding CsgD family transcriptional regulator